MNRILKRPMFRMGGAASGITSGLDRPGYANSDPEGVQKQDEERPAFTRKELSRFLIPFGLDFATRTPSGSGLSGLFSTAAESAKGPVSQIFKARDEQDEIEREKQKIIDQRKFLTDERIASDKSAMERLQEKIKSDETIAGMKTTEDPLYNISLESYIEDGLPPTTAKRAANFQVTFADDLRRAVGGTRFGGVLNFDIRDPNNQKQVKKFFNNKVVYDPYEDNYKYIVIRNGEVFFDEFNSIADIKFPDLTVTPKEKTKPEPVDPFSPNIEDIQGS